MASGIHLDDEGLDKFNSMKIPVKGQPRPRCLVYKISDDKRNIVLDEDLKFYRCGDTAEDQKKEYIDIVKKLPSNSGRYIVWDLKAKNAKSGEENDKLILMSWCPDEAPVISKMIFASSKENIKKKLKGIMFYVNCVDMDDLVNYENVLSQCSK